MKQFVKLIAVALVVASNVITYAEGMNRNAINPRPIDKELAANVVDSTNFDWNNPQGIWSDIVNQLVKYASSELHLSDELGFSMGYATLHALDVMEILYYQRYPNGDWKDIERILFKEPGEIDLESIVVEEC